MSRLPSALFAVAIILTPAAAQPIKIVLVGDSTVHDEGGWGPGFRASFGPPVECLNLARNGRSSKSFRDEGSWAPALAAKPRYVLIQFGHNDNPGKGPERETDPDTTYRANLARYVDESRDAGATPILVTSIVRRNFDASGKIKRDQNVPYVEAVRKLAVDKNVPLIDLYAMTLAQAEELGPAGSAGLGRKAPDGTLDTTHLGPLGQRLIGNMAARELARIEPELKPYLHEMVAWKDGAAPGGLVTPLPAQPSARKPWRPSRTGRFPATAETVSAAR